MRIHFSRLLWAISVLGLTPAVHAQADQPAPYQVYGGYSFLSNCPNGVKASRQALNGWDGSLAMLDWHHLRFKIDVTGYRGSNLGAQQNLLVFTAGGEYGRRFGKEYAYLEGLVGDAGLNKDWGANGAIGQTASFTTLTGGGLDTPLRPHLVLRTQADFEYMNFNSAIASTPSQTLEYPPPTHGLPNFFARITAGVGWSF